MKTGWVIAVEDLHAKDKAFKLVNKTREEVSLKVDKLSKRYESIQAGRFRVGITSPHTEVDMENRIRIKCLRTEECPTKLLFAYLHDLNPFCYKQTDLHDFMEINISSSLNDALSKVDYSVEE